MQDKVQQLLENPDFKPSEHAYTDLKSGRVDPRLLSVLWRLVQKHGIEVSTIKTGHPMGPTTPGGYINSHYYYRAFDIIAVDGKSILEYPTDFAIVDIGRILRAFPPQERPDTIFGPEQWHACLNYPASAGFVSDTFHNSIHADHLHLSFEMEVGTDNRE